MKKVVIISVVGVGLFTAAAACFFSMQASYLGDNTETLLANLKGAQDTCVSDCQNKARSFKECFHTSMDPGQTCSTNWCISNRVYYAECSEATCGGGNPCPYTYHPDAILITQIAKDGAPASCSGINQNPYYLISSKPCRSNSVYVRCVVSSCGGSTVDTSARFGRYECP